MSRGPRRFAKFRECKVPRYIIREIAVLEVTRGTVARDGDNCKSTKGERGVKRDKEKRGYFCPLALVFAPARKRCS